MTSETPTKSVSANEALVQLLGWLDELDNADTYAGFTMNGWLQRKPVQAIEILAKERDSETIPPAA